MGPDSQIPLCGNTEGRADTGFQQDMHQEGVIMQGCAIISGGRAFGGDAPPPSQEAQGHWGSVGIGRGEQPRSSSPPPPRHPRSGPEGDGESGGKQPKPSSLPLDWLDLVSLVEQPEVCRQAQTSFTNW